MTAAACKNIALCHLLNQSGLSPSWARACQILIQIALTLGIAWIVSLLGSRIARRMLRPVARRAQQRSASVRAAQRVNTVASLLASIWKVIVWVTAFFLVLDTLGVNLTPLLAGTAVLGAAFAFGAQNIIRDFLSGFFIVAEDQYGIGDRITVGDVSGLVEELSLRVTRLRAADGTVWYLRNGDIGQVGNRSLHWARALVDVVVPAGTSVEIANQAIAEEANAVAGDPRWSSWCLSQPEVLGVVSSDAKEMTLRVSIVTAAHKDDEVARAIRARINERLVNDGVIGQGRG